MTRWGGVFVQAVGLEWRAEMVRHPRHPGLPNPMESRYYKLGCRSSLDLLYSGSCSSVIFGLPCRYEAISSRISWKERPTLNCRPRQATCCYQVRSKSSAQ